jgi:hypothetical protein
VNSGAANDMDTFGKRISPQVIQEIELSAYRGRKLRSRTGASNCERQYISRCDLYCFDRLRGIAEIRPQQVIQLRSQLPHRHLGKPEVGSGNVTPAFVACVRGNFRKISLSAPGQMLNEFDQNTIANRTAAIGSIYNRLPANKDSIGSAQADCL